MTECPLDDDDAIETPPADRRKLSRSVRVALAITNGGILLGALARLLYGREFEANDPWIGRWLPLLTVIWISAFFYAAYVLVLSEMSWITRALCYLLFALMAVSLVTNLVPAVFGGG